ncbi:hypothetical protein [Dyella sp. C11]|uniref:hypothetical protein n=1 Tax=Dyella sp. C11 TaxID=2126991 RepID=UPI0013002A83|nr:hypothetical protein [Dyella sp. C11]
MNAVFALEPGGPERLVVKLKPFRKGSITLDGQPLVADVPTRQLTKQLKEGMSFPYGNGSVITIQLMAGNIFKLVGMVAKLDGVVLPGSIGTALHAKQAAKSAAVLLYWIAGFNVVGGIVMQFVANNPDGFLAGCLIAVVMAVLGCFVHRRYSLIALGLAMALLAVDGIATLGMQAAAGERPNTGGLFVRVIFVVMLVNVFRAIWPHRQSLRKG